MHPPSLQEQARSSAAPLGAVLILILAAAAALRFWGLRQGIPFALGVDEPEIMDRAVRMMKTGDFNPHFYDYPALYIYLQAMLAVARFVWGAMHAEWASLAQAPTDAFYLWGRALTATLGTLTVWVVFRAGLRWSPVTAVVAATIFAAMPLHVRESHYVLTDVPMTLFVSLTLLCTLRARERPGIAAFALAGAVTGLAAAIKYNGLLAILMPLDACLLSPAMRGVKMKGAAAIAAACGAAFLIAAPYTLLDLPTFLNDFGRLANMYRLNPTGTEPVPVTYLKHVRIALGWTGSLIVLGGLVLAAWRMVKGPDRAGWTIVLLFPVAYFLFVSLQQIVYARYLLPMLPFLALLAGAAIDTAIGWLDVRRAAPRVRQLVTAALLVMAIVPSAWTALRFDADAARVWTTELAYRWIRSNVPTSASVVVESRGLVLREGYKTQNVIQLRLAPDVQQADYLVASSQCYGPYLAAPATYPAEYGDYVRIFRQSQEIARFVPSREHPGPEIRVLKVAR